LLRRRLRGADHDAAARHADATGGPTATARSRMTPEPLRMRA
jgi:hypothetical protein